MLELVLRLTTGEEQVITWMRGTPPPQLKIIVNRSNTNVGSPDLRLVPFSGKDFVRRENTLIYDEVT